MILCVCVCVCVVLLGLSFFVFLTRTFTKLYVLMENPVDIINRESVVSLTRVANVLVVIFVSELIVMVLSKSNPACNILFSGELLAIGFA